MSVNNRAKNPTVFVASYDREQDAFRLSTLEDSTQDHPERQKDHDRGCPVKAFKIELY